MPLPKRQVEPVHVSRGTVPERLTIPCELEAATNGTLANTVRQLSSLSKHAEDIFGELTKHATDIADRTNVLQARIDRLAVKVTQLDSNVEEVSLQDIQMRKPFRSGRAYDQQIFSRASMPSAMLDTYARCDPPPPLERLNEFRDDGKDARKFYTDPDYFFELWRREMLQDTERIQLDRGKKVRSGRGRNDTDGGRTTRRVRPPQSTRERQKQEAIQRGEAIMQNTDYKGPPSEMTDGVYGTVTRPTSVDIGNYHSPRITSNGHVPNEATSPEAWGGLARRPRPSQPPPAPPEVSAPTGLETPTRSNLPPPPPPPAADASPLDLHLHRMHTAIGPAPPPPPTPPAAPPPPPASILNNVAPNSPHVTPQSPHPIHNQPQAPDPRNELLKAIRDGIKLRTVAKSEVSGRYDTLRGTPGPNDVASILQRRLAVEFSDSDESNDENEDDEAWNESRA